jgi:hypothetical protein
LLLQASSDAKGCFADSCFTAPFVYSPWAMLLRAYASMLKLFCALFYHYLLQKTYLQKHYFENEDSGLKTHEDMRIWSPALATMVNFNYIYKLYLYICVKAASSSNMYTLIRFSHTILLYKQMDTGIISRSVAKRPSMAISTVPSIPHLYISYEAGEEKKSKLMTPRNSMLKLPICETLFAFPPVICLMELI